MLKPYELVGIGEFMLWYREKRELTQADIAREFGVTKQYVYAVEHGRFVFPKQFLKRISTILTKTEKEILADAISRSIREFIVNQ